MASHEPPKFKPFTKTKVSLALEATPLPIDQATDLTAFAPKPFRDSEGVSVIDTIKGANVLTTEEVVGPVMFGKKKKTLKAKEIGDVVTTTGIPGLAIKRTKARKSEPPATGKVYSRVDVLSRELQATEVEKLSEDLQLKAKGLLDVETANPYQIEPPSEAFIPLTRNGFGSFLIDQYGPIFPKASQRALDVATCAAKGEEGSKEVKIYHYQAFIREYLRYESPYRGLLVYHGLGSGKTCSAIAAAEALFGTRGMKIVVMTPFSLRDNFIGEISFCGFKHFRLQNHWTSLSLAEGSTPDPGMVKLFAQNVYGIPESYFAKRARGRAQLTRIWIPDFEQKANFDSLKPEERDEISTQLKATIENRIKFINYNGITARELKTMICSTPDVFDNAVIVVDEIHNLTRLIQGSLEVYLGTRTTRGTTVAKEFLTPERKKLPLCGMTKAYMRGYLFYRLFMDAKNAKVIGLSGTPLINFPEELGIMMNIIHGPIHTMEFSVTVEGSRDVRTNIETAVKLNENADTVFFQESKDTSAAVTMVTVTRLPEQFTKILSDDSEVLGIRRRDPQKPVPTLEEVWTQLQTALKADGIKIIGTGTRTAKELLPSWDTPFRGAFLKEDGITLKNVRVLQKRIRGLVSYYRGIQGDVMPKVSKDEIVGVPLTGYSLKIYNKLRNGEIQIEMSKPKDVGNPGDAIWAEIGDIASMKTSSNYRMSSRQACNFVFPEGISRPRPRNLDEQDAETGADRDLIIDADVEGKAPGREQSDAAAEEAAEVEDSAIKAETTGTTAGTGAATATGAATGIIGAKELAVAYKQAIKSAKDKLRTMGPTHLMLDGPPESNLAKYSPKFAAMITKINSLPGSSLVYSQFLEMEGIGIFGICLEANGYVPIEIVDGADGKLRFSERTATSLLKGPKVPENRYIEFTGTGTKEQRGAAVNVFNARLDKVSPAIQKVLKDGGWENNFDGGLCRVFGITSAGAEGLSLKTVRGVHIMEPYWNTARTQQVKGRAVRICSHMDLPLDQQNVEIYTYCTMIPEEALLAQAVDKTLERSDTYSANEAAALGVPVPAPLAPGTDAEALKGMFFKVDEKVEPVPGADSGMEFGPIKFYSKLDNEYRGFSNFAPSPIVVKGKRYNTVEHYFQSSKFPSDLGWQEAIRVAPTPLKAKQLGTQTDHPLRDDWDTVKESIMLEGLRAKFQQNRGLLEQLKGTGDRPLVEASVDAFWGEGRTGKGKNRLGKLLEQVRTELREYVVPPSVPETTSVAIQSKDEFFKSDELIPEEPEPTGAATDVVTGAATGTVIDVVTDVASDAADAATGVVTSVAAGVADAVTGAVTEAVTAVAPAKAPTAAKPVVPTGPTGPVAPATAPTAPVAPVAPTIQIIGPTQKGGDDDRIIILTSDQKVLLISLRKERVIGSLQTLMKTVAVDCQLNFPDNNDGSFRCLALDDSIHTFAYNPDIQKDIEETEARFREKPDVPIVVPEVPLVPKPKAKRIVYRKKEYFYQVKADTSGKPLGYLFFEMSDPDLTKPVGFVVADPKTKLPKGDIGPVP